MLITEKQLFMLFDLAKFLAGINMNWRDNSPPFNRDTIVSLVNEIYNQQSNVLTEAK